jgi:hypothetical protein
MREFFHTVPLGRADLALAAALASTIFLSGELAKILHRAQRRSGAHSSTPPR